jgi:hypothetical protein
MVLLIYMCKTVISVLLGLLLYTAFLNHLIFLSIQKDILLIKKILCLLHSFPLLAAIA